MQKFTKKNTRFSSRATFFFFRLGIFDHQMVCLTTKKHTNKKRFGC